MAIFVFAKIEIFVPYRKNDAKKKTRIKKNYQYLITGVLFKETNSHMVWRVVRNLLYQLLRLWLVFCGGKLRDISKFTLELHLYSFKYGDTGKKSIFATMILENF